MRSVHILRDSFLNLTAKIGSLSSPPDTQDHIRYDVRKYFGPIEPDCVSGTVSRKDIPPVTNSRWRRVRRPVQVDCDPNAILPRQNSENCPSNRRSSVHFSPAIMKIGET
uniref:(northern house mosquito) hypothetical protein n=1 Tax=Culex pipiens TaxID=7175 RepID=A0A8D8H9B8_CULPI